MSEIFGGQTSQQKAATTAETNLNTAETNAANFGTSTAESLYPQAEGELGSAAKYYQELLSGDPGQTEAALAPSVGSIESQYTTAKKANDSFAARGGGTTAADEEAKYKEAGDIGSLFDKAQQVGATGLGTLGAETGSLASSALGGGTSAASVGLGSAEAMANQANVQQQQQQQAGQSIGQLAALLAGL